MQKIATLVLLAACALPVQAQNPRVWLDTDHGPIIIQLYPAESPITVENFLRYVDDGFYDGLIFHRASPGFVIQGGGFDAELDNPEATYDPIVNEAGALSNLRGTVAMARTSEPDSATSQFFVNLDDNTDLDPGGNTEAGYAVFGEVVFGITTVDAIANIPTSNITSPIRTLQQYPRNAPIIERAARIESDGFPVMPDHSGSWFDPQTEGVGFNIEIANGNDGQGPIALVYWYNFDEQRQFWLVGSTPFDYGATEVTVDLSSHPADEEGTGFQSPPESDFSSYGTLTLSFSDCTSGTVTYDMPDYGSGEIAIARLSRPENYNCED